MVGVRVIFKVRHTESFYTRRRARPVAASGFKLPTSHQLISPGRRRLDAHEWVEE
jgi:hypothetical protein